MTMMTYVNVLLTLLALPSAVYCFQACPGCRAPSSSFVSLAAWTSAARVSTSSLATSSSSARSTIPSQPPNCRRQQRSRSVMQMAVKPSDILIMMNGLPGNMGKEVSAACLRKGFRIAPYALTGPDISTDSIEVDDGQGGPKTKVKLVKSGDTAVADSVLQGMQAGCKMMEQILIAIDYSHPSAVNTNAEFYARNKLDFIMGTTGGDRQALSEVTKNGGHYAVIAPNMGKQIVALQATIDHMAKTFPGSFKDYSLSVRESHQKTKADASGTAKALTQDFATLIGEDIDVDEKIELIRTDEESIAFGVPEYALGGHAFHTYSLVSPDGSAEFQFRHNVSGRRMYAEGTADAVAFLAEQIKSKAARKVYNMIDVLKAGGI